LAHYKYSSGRSLDSCGTNSHLPNPPPHPPTALHHI
jgi:hypothetical protein